jgi:glycosyltransferase involved in cell wall biosynthesis
MTRKVVYLTAFEAKPNVGTEAGLAWNWAKSYMKRGFAPVVLTSTIQNSLEREQWENEGIEIITLSQGKSNSAPQGFSDMFRSSIEFSAWRTLCDKFLDSLPQEIQGIAHHVSWGSARLRPPLPSSGSNLVSVIGPLGGGHIPIWRGLSFESALSELLRLSTFLISFINRPFFWLGRKKPDIVLATNRQTEKFLRAKGFDPVFMMFADGISSEQLEKESAVKLERKLEHQILWAGRFVSTKRPDLAVKIVSKLLERGHEVRLKMAGSGPEMTKVVELAGKLKVNVDFLGKLIWSEMTAEYDSSFVFLFHSMRDSSSPGVLEASSKGIPSVGLRVSGAGDFVPSDVLLGPDNFADEGEFLNQTTSLIEELIQDNGKYRMHSEQAIEFAKTQTWDSKVQNVLKLLGQS